MSKARISRLEKVIREPVLQAGCSRVNGDGGQTPAAWNDWDMATLFDGWDKAALFDGWDLDAVANDWDMNDWDLDAVANGWEVLATW